MPSQGILTGRGGVDTLIYDVRFYPDAGILLLPLGRGTGRIRRESVLIESNSMYSILKEVI